MDSGLGSDEDRSKTRTKEQKQLHNQQLLSGCFIDAASLSDDNEVVNQRRNDERRQGALLFQSSFTPQFTVLSSNNEPSTTNPPQSSLMNDDETNTPYNSIVTTLDESERTTRKSPLGFYVDLNEIPDVEPSSDDTKSLAESMASSATKKNIFSLVIDFEGPKKDKPIKLSSSFNNKNKQIKQLMKCNSNGGGGDGGSSSSSISSINAIAGPSRQIDEIESKQINNDNLIKSSSSSSDEFILTNLQTTNVDLMKNLNGICDKNTSTDDDIKSDIKEDMSDDIKINNKHEEETRDSAVQTINQPQFVKLSDLECQKTKIDLNFIPKMSKSIPESSWVESPLLMSRSAGYRSSLPHPLEDDNNDNNNTADEDDELEFIIKNDKQPSRKSTVQRLGTDLLRMFLEEIGPDVIIEVDGHKLKAHKCILASRCQYFAALLSGNWLEDSGNIISLQGFSYESVYFALCHIYSGAAHVPDSISLVELASLADMLGLEGLKEVVEFSLKQRYCHNFHKPCPGCCTGVLEVLSLSAAYGLDDLYQNCLKWITDNFIRIWPNRNFASLSRELREKCLQQHIIYMNNDKVIDILLSCNKILDNLLTIKYRWVEIIQQLILQLIDSCKLFIKNNYSNIISSKFIISLDDDNNDINWNFEEIEFILLINIQYLNIEQLCKSYTRCYKMVEQKWIKQTFINLLCKIQKQLEKFLISQSDKLYRSNAWLRMNSILRCRIKELMPTHEPITASRLPRATPRKNKNLLNSSKSQQSPLLSSSDSSRNSSPGINQTQSQRLISSSSSGGGGGSSGSPSLRRSLLLAARTPQIPPSPLTQRRSTLTQPTQSSAAKCSIIVNKNINKTSSQTSIKSFGGQNTKLTLGQGQQLKEKQTILGNGKKSNTIMRNTSATQVNKKIDSTINKKIDSTINKKQINNSTSRSNSPLKVGDKSPIKKIDSRVTSPIKRDIRTPSPKKLLQQTTTTSSKLSPKTGNKQLKLKNEPIKTTTTTTTTTTTMQRSSTFLKDEPTVLGKVK